MVNHYRSYDYDPYRYDKIAIYDFANIPYLERFQRFQNSLTWNDQHFDQAHLNLNSGTIKTLVVNVKPLDALKLEQEILDVENIGRPKTNSPRFLKNRSPLGLLSTNAVVTGRIAASTNEKKPFSPSGILSAVPSVRNASAMDYMKSDVVMEDVDRGHTAETDSNAENEWRKPLGTDSHLFVSTPQNDPDFFSVFFSKYSVSAHKTPVENLVQQNSPMLTAQELESILQVDLELYSGSDKNDSSMLDLTEIDKMVTPEPLPPFATEDSPDNIADDETVMESDLNIQLCCLIM